MLFTDVEIKKLFYCAKIADQLNNNYSDKPSEIKYINGREIKENNLFVYTNLKNIIFQIEVFLESTVGHDLKDEKVIFLKDMFDNFISFSSNDNFIPVDNLKFTLSNFVWKFYRFINDIFSNKIYIDYEENDVLFDKIESIIDSLRSLNETFGIGSVSRDNIINNNLYDRVVLLEDELKKLTKDVNKNSTQIKETVDGFVLQKHEYFDNQLNDLIEALRFSLSSIHNKYENEIKKKVEKLDDLVTVTNLDFQRTFNDYNQLKSLINIKGEVLITDHYKKRAFWERITYWLMTIGTFAIIIWSISLALHGLDEYRTKTNISISSMIQQYKDQPIEKIEKIYSVVQNNALTYLVLRLIFSVLLFSSIIYTSRVAYRAYVHMRHSENMMLKLATLRPFINQLKEDERNQIHKDLVPDYFGKDAGMVDSTNEKFKDLPANVSAVAMKAIEQISGNSNSPGTEKNTNNQSTGTK